jgi:hypothetical protein
VLDDLDTYGGNPKHRPGFARAGTFWNLVAENGIPEDYEHQKAYRVPSGEEQGDWQIHAIDIARIWERAAVEWAGSRIGR